MNYLKRGLVKTLKSIKEHKLLFIILILLQLIFLASAIYLTITYEVKILENAKGIIEPLQEANYDAESIKEGNPFTEEMASIFNHYNSMMDNIKTLAVWLLFFYIFLNGGIWILTHHLLEKKKLNEIPQIWFKLIISTLVLLVPLILAIYYLLILIMRSEILGGFFTTALNALFYFSIIVYYFLISAFAAANYHCWKDFARRFFINSIKKIHKSLLVLLINFILIFAGIYTIYLAIDYEQSLFLLISTGLLLVIVLVLTRIFWIACLQEIDNVK